MKNEKPIKVAVIGGGCASIAAAFELTRAHHRGKYEVSVYQIGWRLGGKGASGRGASNWIEEHGLHVWLGFYENAFRLLRECYAELNRDPLKCPFADWRDAFFPDPHLGMAHQCANGDWLKWTASFPPGRGLPGDPVDEHNPFSLVNYIGRTVALLQTLLFAVETCREAVKRTSENDATQNANFDNSSSGPIVETIISLLQVGALATTTALIEALSVIQIALRAMPSIPQNVVLSLVEKIAFDLRQRLEGFIVKDDDTRYKWEIIDMVLAILVGTFRFRLLTDPRGLDAIDEFECREWMRMNGASERSLNSAFIRGLYDLALAYEDGDRSRPRVAAGQALRGLFRMFFTYRGAFLWKMRAGMGDVVFAPFYEILTRRGVNFHFFHRLTNVKLAPQLALRPNERPYVEGLEFDVQAEVQRRGGYQPLTEINGIPCWPSEPDYDQLRKGNSLRKNGQDFESHWDRRRVGSKTLRVMRDFDFVVLGVSIGEIPHVCKEIVARDERWREMVDNVKTVATQAFQVWLNEDLEQLGWTGRPVILAGFAQPFDTWSAMEHVVPAESWQSSPKSVAYFCGALEDKPVGSCGDVSSYPTERREEVRRNAIRFLNEQIQHLWPNAVLSSGQFRWELLCDPCGEPPSESERDDRFNSQFWTANVNPSDRFVLALPGSARYRISPLDNTYNNITIAGDWTDCGFNEGCVEAAVMSGRLAAHAIAGTPSLEDIVGYDHP